MAGVRLRLPHWTAHPGFGVAVLLALAIVLILHGEPQPSSRPSGTSVVVGSKTPANVVLPSTLVISNGLLERRQGNQVLPIALPAGEKPVSVLTSGRLTVALAVRDGHQRAYGIGASLRVTDLGYADAVIASTYPGATVVIERASIDPGVVNPSTSPSSTGASSVGNSASPTPAVTGAPDGYSMADGPGAADPSASLATAPDDSSGASSATAPDDSSTASSSSGSGKIVPPPRDYTARRYDASGRPLGQPLALLPGARIATDTAEGLLVWRPVRVTTQRGQVTESLSATASLIRPDLSVRVIGPVHPLAATDSELLVWDVGRSEFGLMPLSLVTATTTRTAIPALGSSAPGGSSAELSSASESPTVSVSPSTVAGTRWFQPTRGFVVTGPATFSPDGEFFAAYGQVGNRRRLIIGRTAAVGTDQIDVLALSQPAPLSPSASGSGSGSVSGTLSDSAVDSDPVGGSSVLSVSGTVSPPTRVTPLPSPRATGSTVNASSGLGSAGTGSAGTGSAGSGSPGLSPGTSASAVSGSPTASGSGYQSEGFPVAAPAVPVWLDTLVVALAPDGAVIGYVPGHSVASVLDFGAAAITSLAAAP